MWIDNLVFEQCDQQVFLKIWIPENTMVVLGRSNRPETEVHLLNCQEDGIEVLKRKGGGGTVVLHPGCLVVSLGLWVGSYFENKRFFTLINQSIMDSLTSLDSTFHGMAEAGISDIAFGDLKIAGTSLFRSRNYLSYQGSVLYDRKISLIERYLTHPSVEPEYRKNKCHRDFVGDLRSISSNIEMGKVYNHLDRNLLKVLSEKFSGDLIMPVEKQINHIKKLIK